MMYVQPHDKVWSDLIPTKFPQNSRRFYHILVTYNRFMAFFELQQIQNISEITALKECESSWQRTLDITACTMFYVVDDVNESILDYSKIIAAHFHI